MTFFVTFSNSIPNWVTFGFWPNDSLTFSLFVYLHSCIPAYLLICILVYLNTCILTYLQIFVFLLHLNQTWRGWGFKMSKHSVTGQYWSIPFNIGQCLKILEIFDNFEQYLNVHYNIITLKRMDWNSHMCNIEQYRTILDNIGEYLAMLDINNIVLY